mmetsp:Transcript_123253/g.275258  ORF Transcript_123253/g.275258 Transcript_123253/m.275258 type:complete len:337 (-) Transcript_123253:583-1593(-)
MHTLSATDVCADAPCRRMSSMSAPSYGLTQASRASLSTDHCAQLELAGVAVRARRQVHHRVFVKEPNREQVEPCLFHGHHWPILRPRDMSGSDGVPRHEIAIHNVAITLGVIGQTITRTSHGRVLSGGVELLIFVGCCPQVVLGESGTLRNCGGIMRKQVRRGTLKDLIGNRLSETIVFSTVYDLPSAVLLWRKYPLRLTLGLQQPALDTEKIATRILRTLGEQLHLFLTQAVGATIEIPIQSEAEEVLMDGRSNVLRDNWCELGIRCLPTAHRHDACKFYLYLDLAVKVEVVVPTVIIVAHSTEAADNEPASTPHLRDPSAGISGFPLNACILFM